MAVNQVSRVQHRRGLQQDLPQLASAELGWSIDSRRLFIGNGVLGEGAPSEGVTEILTQYTDFASIVPNYIFKGLGAGYIAQTGPTQSAPATRVLQAKLDDVVNVHDFGAIGDGATDDTAAINRAISQLYLSSVIQTSNAPRRTLYVPAGTYVISAAILIPSWLRIIGDGMESTVIKQTGLFTLFQFSDSAYQTGALLGTNGAQVATFVDIECMTLQTTVDRDIAVIDSSTNVNFRLVEFRGSIIGATSAPGIAYAGVKFLQQTAAADRIDFDLCKFINLNYAILSDVASTNVRVRSSYFYGLYKGFKLGENSVSTATAPSNFRITNSSFDKIANRAIDCYANCIGTISYSNHYGDVGNNLSVTPVSTVMNFASNGNQSLADTFARSDADDITFARVGINGSKVVSLQANVGLQMGSITVGSGSQVILADNATLTNTSIVLPSPCIFNYSLLRNGTTQIGSITFNNPAAAPQYVDNFTSTTTSPGVVLSVTTGNLVAYTSTSTGNTATLKYNIVHF